MKHINATIVGTLLCLLALAAWSYMAPAAGSGWILFVAFLGTLSFLDSIRNASLALWSGIIVTAASGATWFLHQHLEHSGWVLFLFILCGLGTFNILMKVMRESN